MDQGFLNIEMEKRENRVHLKTGFDLEFGQVGIMTVKRSSLANIREEGRMVNGQGFMLMVKRSIREIINIVSRLGNGHISITRGAKP